MPRPDIAGDTAPATAAPLPAPVHKPQKRIYLLVCLYGGDATTVFVSSNINRVKAVRDSLRAMYGSLAQFHTVTNRWPPVRWKEWERQLRQELGMAVDEAPAAELSEEIPLPAWQPIATAPKDGTEILCFEAGATYVAAWRLWFTSGRWKTEHYAWFAARGDDQFFGFDGHEAEPNCKLEPTHWLPLPAPPGEPA